LPKEAPQLRWRRMAPRGSPEEGGGSKGKTVSVGTVSEEPRTRGPGSGNRATVSIDLSLSKGVTEF
jgi:hypothetical protein